MIEHGTCTLTFNRFTSSHCNNICFLRKGGFPVLARSSSQLAAGDAWALSSNHNAKQLILIRCKHSQRAARSFVRGLENRLNLRLHLILFFMQKSCLVHDFYCHTAFGISLRCYNYVACTEWYLMFVMEILCLCWYILCGRPIWLSLT
jgi:hypothetical protein